MNRIILIGNGFDLAHRLKTGYTHFMDWYWTEFAKKYSKSQGLYEDEFAKLEHINGPCGWFEARSRVDYYNDPDCKIFISFGKEIVNIESYADLKDLIEEANEKSNLKYTLSFKNNFFGHISDKTCLQTWLDIENEYYEHLKSILSQPKDKRNALVRKLNEEFGAVKNLLEKYLTEVCNTQVAKIKSIEEYFGVNSVIGFHDVATSRQQTFFDDMERHKKETYDALRQWPEYSADKIGDEELRKSIHEKSGDGLAMPPRHAILINFNYTDTAKAYSRQYDDILCIHGQLNNETNPIVFGYGDELDEDYRKIENTNDNDFLENIKSSRYHTTDIYKKTLMWLQAEPYQVFVMGHSCGNSDRTLLNTTFEHPNCVSIKLFYHQWKDEATGVIKDNYTDIVNNIARNFNDKKALRDIVVNKEYCHPLVPCEK